MSGKRATGGRYEKKAMEYLLSKNYRILGQNINYKFGEIDLVAEERVRSRVYLVFVEVRKRDSRGFLRPEETITPDKKRRLVHAIQKYLLSYRGSAKEMRIDLIGFWDETITHHEGFISL